MPLVSGGAISMTGTSVLGLSEFALVPGPNTAPGPTTIPGPEISITEYPTVPTLTGQTTFTAGGIDIAVSHANLTGTGALTGAAWATYRAATPTWAAVGTLTEAPTATFYVGAGSVVIVGTATLTLVVRETEFVTGVVFAPSGVLVAGATSKQFSTVSTLTGVASLSANAVIGALRADMAGVARLVTAGVVAAVAEAVFAPVGTLLENATATAVSAVALVGDSSFTTLLLSSGRASATLSAAAALAVAAVDIAVAAVSLTAAAALAEQLTGLFFVGAVPTFTAFGVLHPEGARTFFGDVALGAAAALVVATPTPGKIALVVMTASTVLVATAGVHPLIPPGFTPGPVQPRFVAPQWTVYVADTRTGRIAYEIPTSSLQWQSRLNDIGTAQATIMVQDAYDVIRSWSPENPRMLFRQFLSGPYRFSLVLAYGNNAVWAGPITKITAASDGASVQVGASEFMHMFTKRLFVGRSTGDNTPPAGLSIGPTSKQVMVEAALDWGTRGYSVATYPQASYAVPWYVGCTYPTDGDDVRSWKGSDFPTVWDVVSAISQEADGPDVRFDPTIVQQSDGLYCKYALMIGSPAVPQQHVCTWDVPSTATLGWTVDTQNFATMYWAEGAGQDQYKLVAQAKNPSLANLGFPELEMSDALHSSVVDPYALQSLVDADMALYEQPSAKWTASVQASREPVIGSFRVGDTIGLSVSDHPTVSDGNYVRRITELAGDQTEWVQIGSSDAYVIQATTQEGVQLITNG